MFHTSAEDNENTRRERPVIALDGTESVEGRGLLAISALYWCAEWLTEVETRLIDVSDENVELAVEVLRADTGLDVRLEPPSELWSPLEGVDLYAAVAFRSAHHLRLVEAARAGIPVMLALQFPDPEYFNAYSVLRQRAAFDPHVFASELYNVVKPWL